MVGYYLLAFLAAFVFDVIPVPFPPAMTALVFLQIQFQLNPWLVVSAGVLGSILGRYVLTLYIPKLSGKLLKSSKKEDVSYLGKQIKKGGWKGQGAILIYCLLPLPTTPLFIAAGVAKCSPWTIIPAFFVGKFTSDAISVMTGKFAAQNKDKILQDLTSWKSIVAMILGILILTALVLIDWRELIQHRKFKLKIKVWK